MHYGVDPLREASGGFGPSLVFRTGLLGPAILEKRDTRIKIRNPQSSIGNYLGCDRPGFTVVDATGTSGSS